MYFSYYYIRVSFSNYFFLNINITAVRKSYFIKLFEIVQYETKKRTKILVETVLLNLKGRFDETVRCYDVCDNFQ